MTVTPQEKLYELNLQLSNEIVVVSDSLRSDAYRMQNCRHFGKFASNCHSIFCLMCGRRQAEVLNVKLHDRVQAVQSNFPDARFLFATLPIADTPTTCIRSSASSLKKGWNKLLRPVRGLLGSFTALEVAASHKAPELENTHLHSLVALDPTVHVGDNYITYQKWAANWQDQMQGLARDANIDRARELAHVIDYIVPSAWQTPKDKSLDKKPSRKGIIDRANEALANPTRYVERVRQLWKFPHHWCSGKLGRIIIPPFDEPDLCGLNSVKGSDLEYEMAKTSRPATKNLPIPIGDTD